MFRVQNLLFLLALGFLYFLVLLQIQLQSAEALVFYDLNNFTGDAYRAPDGWDAWASTGLQTCNNMPSFFNDRASSVNVENSCVYLFKNFDCTGFFIMLEINESHVDLSERNFDNTVSSFQGC